MVKEVKLFETRKGDTFRSRKEAEEREFSDDIMVIIQGDVEISYEEAKRITDIIVKNKRELYVYFKRMFVSEDAPVIEELLTKI